MLYIKYIAIVGLILFLTTIIRQKLRGSLTLDILRLTVFFLPFFLAIIFYGVPTISFNSNVLGSFIIAIASSLLGLLVQYQDFKPFFNKSFYYLMPMRNKINLISLELTLLLSPIFEELLYRYYLPKSNFYVDFLLSGMIFSLVHILNDYLRRKFTLKNYFILFLLGSSWYISYAISDNIIPAIIGHLIYNLPNALISYLRFYIPYKG